jgi:ArsR family transcriptional regulator
MNNSDMHKHTILFKALSNPIRLKILMHIAKCKDCDHKHNISELSQDCGVDFSVVSRHLKTLKESGILNSIKDKNDVIYKFNKKEFKQHLKNFSENF